MQYDDLQYLTTALKSEHSVEPLHSAVMYTSKHFLQCTNTMFSKSDQGPSASTSLSIANLVFEVEIVCQSCGILSLLRLPNGSERFPMGLLQYLHLHNALQGFPAARHLHEDALPSWLHAEKFSLLLSLTFTPHRHFVCESTLDASNEEDIIQ